jgi:hypothetical protein
VILGSQRRSAFPNHWSLESSGTLPMALASRAHVPASACVFPVALGDQQCFPWGGSSSQPTSGRCCCVLTARFAFCGGSGANAWWVAT